MSNQDKSFYFVSGLPRSGSTLLCNVLAQNPDFHTTATSGVADIMIGVRNGWDDVLNIRASTTPEYSKERARAVIGGILRSYYEYVGKPVVLDKSRAWPAHIEMLDAVLTEPVKIIATVRDVRDILASLELLRRKQTALGLTSQDKAHGLAMSTLKGRCDIWAQGDQILGSAYNALKDAIDRGWSKSILFVRFEDLTAHPESTLARIYNFIEQPLYDHDFNNVEQVIVEDDRYHGFGFAGLHDIRPKIEPQSPRWPGVLGEVASSYKNLDFW